MRFRSIMLVQVLYACCLICTVPALFWPPLRGVFSVRGPMPWGPVTGAFSHGFAGVPPLLHLLANTFFFFTVGVWAEKLLGSARFGLLTLAALVAYAGVQLGGGVSADGSSVFLYAYGPVALVALRHRTAERGPDGHEVWDRVRGMLVVMYLVVTAMMAGFVYMAGFRGDPIRALVQGNLFHLVATAVGIPLALLWRRRIADRAETLEDPGRGPSARPDAPTGWPSGSGAASGWRCWRPWWRRWPAPCRDPPPRPGRRDGLRRHFFAAARCRRV